MMHPTMAWEIIRQRESDLRAQARADGTAKAAHRAAKAQRVAAAAAAAAAAAVPVPQVPDYVDGTFHVAGDCTHAGA
jgi:hypothetical protein